MVCAAPDGRVFVAEDPMDISAPADAAQGRIVCFHPDGRRTVFAEKLHAVFGMQYLEGRLYVLHNPEFTVFIDDNGIGQEPLTLIKQTNPNPWALDWNDHVPANFQLAMDGYFYIAVGDKGIYGAVGRDGKRADLRGGGILRLRPDGTGLEVYCNGVRNILDVAINAEDEMFTYDNTDEHDWMGRLTHMVEGGFYGYPHDFIPRRAYTLWMMHDFGAGAATGALAYNEDALPADYRGNLFLGDFGKRQVTRVVIERAGATFRVNRHEEMFKDLPDDFRPVGIAVSADGASLYICDWQHRDTKEDIQAGRLWNLKWTGRNESLPKPPWYLPAAMGRSFKATGSELVQGLSHPSRTVRLTAQRQLGERRDARPVLELLRSTNAAGVARSHALWALDAIDGGSTAPAELLEAISDHDPIVRRQAIRRAGLRKEGRALNVLNAALKDNDAAIRFQAATALGRIADTNSISDLRLALTDRDLFVRFAAFTALNRIGRQHPSAWAHIASALASSDEQVREGASFALRETYDPTLLEALVTVAQASPYSTAARETALRLVAVLHHKAPAWKGEWWAYHPALSPPPAKIEAWLGTIQVLATLRKALTDAEPAVRVAAVDGIRLASDTTAVPGLRSQFETETNTAVRRAILEALASFKDEDSAGLVISLLAEPARNKAVLPEAIRAAEQIGGEKIAAGLTPLLQSESVDSLARGQAIDALATLKITNAVSAIAAQVGSAEAEVRAKAIRALGRIGGAAALHILGSLLTNDSRDIRQRAVVALGDSRDRNSVPALMNAWKVEDTRSQALDALSRISDVRALDAYLDGLNSANPATREQSRKALIPIRDIVLPELEARAPALSGSVVVELRRVYEQHAVARIGPLFSVSARVLEPSDYERHALQRSGDAVRGQRIFFDESGVACLKCHAVAGHGGSVGPDLTLIGAQFPRAALIEHVLQPSKAVREGYQQILVAMRDGEEFAGILKTETPDTVSLLDANNRLLALPKKEIASRTASKVSLMPEGLHVGLTLDQFADLIAFLESRRVDPTKLISAAAAPAGFELIFDGRTLEGWRELPPGTKRVDAAALQLGRPPEHWEATNGVLEHDGMTGDLWTEREFPDFYLHLEWRWPGAPKWEVFPLINSDGLEGDEQGHAASMRVLDAGDSGVLLRGLYKAQANLFCYPIGSGEVWEYRTDASMTPEQRRAVTPRSAADRPVGDWNEMWIRLRGDRLSVELNGVEVIHDAQLPGLPPRGPVGLQHEHGRIQFRNLWIRESR